jgi:uncharacterized SAM-binding protein YcdF (DUF218 family)
MSIILLVALLILALILAHLKRIKSCRAMLTLTLAYVIAIGSGLAPYLLLMPLQAPFVNLAMPQWKQFNAIVLLGGGITTPLGSNTYIPFILSYSRINKTAELYFSCIKQHVCKIIISGGPIEKIQPSEALVYERALMKLGVSHDDVILESNSTDTQTNAEFTSAILKKFHFDQVILVTSSMHLKRSLMWFSYFGVQAQPVPADYISPYRQIMSLGSNFASTDSALHEYLGIVEVCFYMGLKA